jgi:hypothetical protein
MPDVALKSLGFRSDEEQSLARLARLERAASCLEGPRRAIKVNRIKDLHGPKRVNAGQDDPANAPRARLKKSPDFRG